MSKIKSENYYVIHGWMLNNLNLSGTQLQVYAIIYGFSQDGNTSFSGSLSYLCDFTGAGRTTIVTALNKLVDKKLIEKNVTCTNGVRFVTYKVNLNAINCNGTPSTDSELPRTESELPSTKSVLGNHGGGSTKSVPNKESLSIDKEIYNDIYNISGSSDDEPQPNKKSTRFVPPTVAEVRDYCSERKNNINPETFVDHYISVGWKVGKNPIKDWKAAVRLWERRDNSANKNQSKPSAGFGYRELD